MPAGVEAGLLLGLAQRALRPRSRRRRGSRRGRTPAPAATASCAPARSAAGQDPRGPSPKSTRTAPSRGGGSSGGTKPERSSARIAATPSRNGSSQSGRSARCSRVGAARGGGAGGVGHAQSLPSRRVDAGVFAHEGGQLLVGVEGALTKVTTALGVDEQRAGQAEDLQLVGERAARVGELRVGRPRSRPPGRAPRRGRGPGSRPPAPRAGRRPLVAAAPGWAAPSRRAAPAGPQVDDGRSRHVAENRVRAAAQARRGSAAAARWLPPVLACGGQASTPAAALAVPQRRGVDVDARLDRR